MAIIILSGQLTSSSSDILNSTRLQTAEAGGVMLFELEADVADASNNGLVSLQLPNGATPMENVLIPANAAGVDGVLDEREKLMASFPVSQGGHVVFGVTITGTVVVTYRITYQG